MEKRTKDITKVARDAENTIRETAAEWADQTKAMGTAALEKAQEAYEYAQNKAVSGAKATDRAIRDNPYRALGIAFGVGLLIGFLTRRK